MPASQPAASLGRAAELLPWRRGGRQSRHARLPGQSAGCLPSQALGPPLDLRTVPPSSCLRAQPTPIFSTFTLCCALNKPVSFFMSPPPPPPSASTARGVSLCALRRGVAACKNGEEGRFSGEGLKKGKGKDEEGTWIRTISLSQLQRSSAPGRRMEDTVVFLF